MKYELLQEGDVIKEGDECFNDEERWVGVMESDIGKLFRTRIYRPMRRLATKPKASLEELAKFIKQRIYSDNTFAELNSVLFAQSICAHLGIELEDEKQEWERAYEGYLKEAKQKVCKELFKLIWDWQACEKSKEK